MATAADDIMPPRPDVEFDFNLPHGIDSEEAAASNDQHNHDYQDDHDFMEEVRHTTEPNNDLDLYDQDTGEQDMNYNVMPKGFSDDEDAGEAFDRSWSGRQAKKSSPKNKKSPKRSSDDGDDEASPMTKKPRKSLFGGPMEGNDEERPDEEPEEYIVHWDDNVREPKTPRHCIVKRLSSLSLEQQEREDSPAERPFNFGFGITTSNRDSDRGSMSPTPAPDTSNENVFIPPDTEVSASLYNAYSRRAITYIFSLPMNSARISRGRKPSPTLTRTCPATSTQQKKLNRRL
jgi:hypothetical protein